MVKKIKAKKEVLKKIKKPIVEKEVVEKEVTLSPRRYISEKGIGDIQVKIKG